MALILNWTGSMEAWEGGDMGTGIWHGQTRPAYYPLPQHPAPPVQAHLIQLPACDVRLQAISGGAGGTACSTSMGWRGAGQGAQRGNCWATGQHERCSSLGLSRAPHLLHISQPLHNAVGPRGAAGVGAHAIGCVRWPCRCGRLRKGGRGKGNGWQSGGLQQSAIELQDSSQPPALQSSQQAATACAHTCSSLPGGACGLVPPGKAYQNERSFSTVSLQGMGATKQTPTTSEED